MQSLDLVPTNENLISTLEDDIFDRNRDLLRFIDLLENVTDSFSVAIDGKWGSGKTFFVKHIKILLDTYNPFLHRIKEDDKSRIKTSIHKITHKELVLQKNYVAVYYDAWENDSDPDPMLSLIYQIITQVDTDFTFAEGPSGKQIIEEIADALNIKGVKQLLELTKKEDPLGETKGRKNLHRLIVEFLNSLLPEKGNKLVVFVDELDRCKPDFAIHLLELIKHYFSVPNVVFVFSVNMEQLQYTVKRCYGESFDGSRYLNRFFDIVVSLPSAYMNKFYSQNGMNSGHVQEQICFSCIRYFEMQIREIGKFLRAVQIASGTIVNKSWGFPEENALLFSYLYVLPIIIAAKICNSEKCEAFTNGRGSEMFLTIVSCAGLWPAAFSYLLEDRERFGVDPLVPNGPDEINLSDRLTAAYNAIFVHTYPSINSELKIGQLAFSERTRQNLLKAASILSPYADYSQFQ